MNAKEHLAEIITEATNPRVGKCYELAGGYVSTHPDSILVHGLIKNPFGKGLGEIKHAWVENGNEIFDPVMDISWPKDVYENLFKAKISKKYTNRQTLKMTLDYEHWGPWS